jgi:hypothetical protein
MAPLDRVRASLDQPGRDLNDATRHYAEHSSEAPFAIKAEPVLYGELARGALHWTGDLLTAIERSAATRPAAETVAGPFVDHVAAYFEHSARWPTVSEMEHPLRLLMPAYYAVHAVHLLGYHVLPPLLQVEYDEPLAFVEEMLGPGPSMTIRQHKNADLSSMPKVVEEATPSEPLVFRSFLSAKQRERLAQARATAQPVHVDPAPAEPAPISAESGASPAQDDADSVLAALWTGRLRDTRITLRAENSFEPGYSGTSSYFSAETLLDLHDGGRYRLQETVTSSITGTGMSIGGEPRTTESSGKWSVHVSGTSERLRLEGDEGDVTTYGIGAAGSGALEVDGQDRRWTPL